MANNLTGNPLSVDTAAVIYTKPVYVIRMVWESPTTSGHAIDVTDNAGHKVWATTAIAGGTGITYEREIGCSCSGLTIATIESGTLYIYIQ
jgi:hypothetical protein